MGNLLAPADRGRRVPRVVARAAIGESMEVYYNSKRRQSSLTVLFYRNVGPADEAAR